MKDKDEYFWEGFDTAMQLVFKVFENSPEEDSAGLLEEIESEISIYKQGG
jgi:hypothetical protein